MPEDIDQARIDNEAFNRSIVTRAFVNVEPKIVDMLNTLINDVDHGTILNKQLTAKSVAWCILDVMTRH